MPMLKTVSTGTSSVTNMQSYLMRQQRQEHAAAEEELRRYRMGEIQLSPRQAGHLEEYLGQTSRGLAVDVSEDLSVRRWPQQMDLTRVQYDHDRPTTTGKSRSYYHFVLSPDPLDGCTLSMLRAYAREWAEVNFRSGGRLHEYAIVYHDDNAKRVLHAHIVVNVTNKATGRKLHLGNDEVVTLGRSAQAIGIRHGLSPIREESEYRSIRPRTTQPVYIDRKEREVLNKGGYSWKWECARSWRTWPRSLRTLTTSANGSKQPA